MLIDKFAAQQAVVALGERTADNSPFYREQHTAIYLAMLSLQRRSEPIDVLTVVNELRTMGKLEEAGGPAYPVELTSLVVTTANVTAHARLLIEKHIARELIRTCEETKLKAFLGEDDTFEMIDNAASKFMDLGAVRSVNKTKNSSALTYNVVERLVNDVVDPYIPSDLVDLDALIHGFYDGDLTVVAARPSMGKSALMLCLARAAARRKKPVHIFSGEMKPDRLVQRMLANESSVFYHKLRTGQLTDIDKGKIIEASEKLYEMPMFFSESAGWTPSQIRGEALRLHQSEKTAMILIDYLQIIAPPFFSDNVDRMVGETCRMIKALAQELSVPVILLSQLNRQVEQRRTRRPSLGDLKNSGDIEAHTDGIIFIYRPEQYGAENEVNQGMSRDQGYTELIVAKQRDGLTGTAEVRYKGEFMRFEDKPLTLRTFAEIANDGVEIPY